MLIHWLTMLIHWFSWDGIAIGVPAKNLSPSRFGAQLTHEQPFWDQNSPRAQKDHERWSITLW